MPILLGRARVPVMSVPILLPAMIVPVVPLLSRDPFELPEIRLASPGTLPPIVLPEVPCNVSIPTALGTAKVPVMSVPILLPAMIVFVVPPPKRMIP